MNKKKQETLVKLLKEMRNEYIHKTGRSTAVDCIDYLEGVILKENALSKS